MTVHGLTLSSLAMAAMVLPCGTRLPMDDLKRHAANFEQKSGEFERCDKLRTTPIGLQEEQAVGQTTALQIIRDGGLTHDGKETASLRALNRLGVALALMSERPGLEWTFGILEDDGVNAFATPGGYIFVTRGLLLTVENEAQLAGVLAHEISHVNHQHALNHYRPLKANACHTMAAKDLAVDAAGKVTGQLLDSQLAHIDFDGAVDAATSALLEELAKGLIKLMAEKGYPASEELQADHGAVSLMITAGYDPSEYRKLLSRLPAEKNLKNHPPVSERVASVDQRIAALKGDPLCGGAHPFGTDQGFRAPPLSKDLLTALK